MPVLQRVKVYRLNKESGTWDDKGTGSVSVEFLEVRDVELKRERGPAVLAGRLAVCGWARRAAVGAEVRQLPVEGRGRGRGRALGSTTQGV